MACSMRFNILALLLLEFLVFLQYGNIIEAIPNYRVKNRQDSQSSSSEEPINSIEISEERIQDRESHEPSEENFPISLSQEEINNNSEPENKGSRESEEFHGQYSSLWSDGKVKYKVDAKLTHKQMQELTNAIEEYHSKTCIRFDSNVPSGSLDHLSIQTAPVNGKLNVGATATTCHTKRDNYVLFREDYLTRNAMLHEFGHSLCFYHEHQRPDRHEYIEMRGKCGENDSWSSKQYQNHTTNALYDFASIWHYSCVTTACIKPKSEYSAVKKCGADMEKGLSVLDADLINDLYNCQGCLRHRWRPIDNLSPEDIENLPDLGYNRKNGRSIFPCRAIVGKGQEIAVGWWDKNNKQCKLTFGKTEIKSTKAEVLIIPKTKGKTAKSTYHVTPTLAGGVTAGYSINPYEVMYIAFMKDANNLGYIGKAIEKNGRLDKATFFVNGKVVTMKQFSILTCSSKVTTSLNEENELSNESENFDTSLENQGSADEEINLSTSVEKVEEEHGDNNMNSVETQTLSNENHEDVIQHPNSSIDDDNVDSGSEENEDVNKVNENVGDNETEDVNVNDYGSVHSLENSVEEDEAKDDAFPLSTFNSCSTPSLQDMIKTRDEKYGDKLSSSVESGDNGSEELISPHPMKWPGGIVKYKIDSSLNQNDIDQLKVAINEYAKKTCIQIVPAQANELHTLISINDTVCGEASVCQWSENNYIFVGQNCRENDTFVHELGHALCLQHEHVRNDREHFVKISDECQSRSYIVREKYIYDSFYDYASVMHYGCNTNCIKPNPTRVTECGPQQKPRLSVIDADVLNELYDCQNCFRHRWNQIYTLTPGDVKNMPDFGYRNQAGTPLYVCRTRSSTWQEIAVGWYDEKNKACVVISEGKEYSNRAIGEVLTIPGGLGSKNGNYKLTPVMKGKGVHVDDLVPGGNTLSPYHVMYIGFMKDEQGVGQIGKVISKNGKLDNATFFANGKVLETDKFSILACTHSDKSQENQVYSNLLSDSNESNNSEYLRSDKSKSEENDNEKQESTSFNEPQVDSSENSGSKNDQSDGSMSVEVNDPENSMELEVVNPSEEVKEAYEQESDER